jgi:hypothetical protein
MRPTLPALSCAALFVIGGCASDGPPKPPSHLFETTFKDPEAKPMQVRGSKVVAAVMVRDVAARKRAEDALAAEITRLGGQGVPMYTISLENTPTKEGETQTRAAVEAIGGQGLVVMRPVDVNHRSRATDTIASNDMYGGYWGGYYGIGWADPWIDKNPDVQTDIVVTVETFVFSLPQNKLVWSGTSETTNPKNAEKLTQQLAQDSVRELQRLGLLAN